MRDRTLPDRTLADRTVPDCTLPDRTLADGPPPGARDAEARAENRGDVVMAEIGAAHGVRGAVRLAVFAEDPLGLRRYNPFRTDDGRTIRLIAVRTVGRSVVVEIDGITDRNTAETLSGTRLLVPRSRLPRPPEDEFYYIDLVGLTARLPDGSVLGTVYGVADHGAGDVLEIRGPTDVLVPFTRIVVPEVNVAAGYLVIDPPAGLLGGAVESVLEDSGTALAGDAGNGEGEKPGGRTGTAQDP